MGFKVFYLTDEVFNDSEEEAMTRAEERHYYRRLRKNARNKRKLERYRKIRKLPIMQKLPIIRIALFHKILELFDNNNITWFEALKRAYIDWEEIKREKLKEEC